MAAFGIFALLVFLSWMLPTPDLLWFAVFILLAITATLLNRPYRGPKDIYRPQVSNVGVMVMVGIIIFFYNWVWLGLFVGALAETRLWAVSHANWVASWFPWYNYQEPLLGKSVYAMLAAELSTATVLLLWLFELFEQFTYDRNQDR
jgi:hypothetical protein